MKKQTLLPVVLTLLLASCGNGPAPVSSSSSTQSSSSSQSESSSSSSSSVEPAKKLLASYDFSDPLNLAKDSSGEGNDGTVVDGGHLFVPTAKWKGKNVLSFSCDGKGQDYLELNHGISSYSSLTIASWVYIPSPLEDFNNQAPLLSIKKDNGDYIYSSPYDTECWFGYSVNVRLNGEEKKLTQVPASEETHWHNTPVTGTIQSVPGAWHLMAYELSSDSLSVYQNGNHMYSYQGNYSLSSGSLAELRIGSSSIGAALDFNGMVSDIRVYDGLLSESALKKEYSLEYEDFLTTDFSFNGTFVDSSRGLIASPNGSAELLSKDGRECVYLDGSGTGPDNKSSVNLPTQTLHGHNKITISTDLYIENTGDLYQRIFEFSIGGARFLSAYVGFATKNNLKIEYAPDVEKARDTLLDPSFLVPVDRWTNITMTADGSVGRLYVDGYLISENPDFKYDPVICYYWPDLHCTLGRTDFYGDRPMTGYFDNFKMYQTALTEKEVMEMNGTIIEEDDQKAVKNAIDAFQIEYENDYRISLPKKALDGVRISYEIITPESMDSNGNLYPKDTSSKGTFKATFKRDEYEESKLFEVNITAKGTPIFVQTSADLDEVTYDESTYFDESMLTNIDYMFSLDTERLLYNYRLNAQLDTKGASSYGGWIATNTGGAGQFESQYVGALARYCLSKPDYVSKTAPAETNTPAKRLAYMLSEMRKCQVAYGALYPEEKGYLSAFTHLCMEAIENGSSTVEGGEGQHGQVPIGGITAWVPFYMYHKNLMMCYDVYTYATDSTVKRLAYDMFVDAGLWVYNELSPLSDQKRANVLAVEYGGMGEVMYLGYGITSDYRFLNIAHFFEENLLLDSIYDGNNPFAHLHCNTTLPKILACCAAYEVLGDERCKTIAIKAWDMIANHMTYANGGVSINEVFEEPDLTSQGCYGEETCCSYNMLRISEYLYRWTGDVKYADYFEKVFYNHIMASMDPLTGGKTYPVSTTFGYHKIYSNATNAFWCCCCTGQESFSKLNWGNYFRSADGDSITVNMYNQSVYESGAVKLAISGDLFLDEAVHVAVTAPSKQKIRFRVPSWCENAKFVLNGVELDLTPCNGYVEIDRVWSTEDDLLIELPMDYSLVEQRGFEGNYALYYGPLMLVAHLDEANVADCLNSDLTAGGTYGGQYVGPLSRFMLLDGKKETWKSCISRSVKDGKLVFSFEADNQVMEFIPFMDCYYGYYSMYMTYVFDSTIVVVDGKRTDLDLSSSASFYVYKSSSACKSGFGESGLSLVGGEQKVIANGVNIGDEYEVGFTLSSNSALGEINAGVYLGASNPGKGQDAINALNLQIERNPGSSTAYISLFKFSQSYQGCIERATIACGDTISLRAIAKEGIFYVFEGGNALPIMMFKIDMALTQGGIGFRNQGNSSVTFSSAYYIA